MNKPTIGFAIAVAMVAGSSSACAAPLLFTFSDTSNSSFQIDSSPVPDSANIFSFTTIGSNGSVNGAPFDFGTIRFFSNLGGGGVFSEFGTTGGFGAQLFSGTTAAPVFSPGTFALVDFRGDPATTLRISAVASAVPEPATWAMMLVGFGGMGFAMRRRSKRRTTASYA